MSCFLNSASVFDLFLQLLLMPLCARPRSFSSVASNAPMCKTKTAVDASQPTPSRRSDSSTRATHSPRTPSTRPPTQFRSAPNYASASSYPASSSQSFTKPSSANTSLSSRTSLTSLRESISENPHIYGFNEIRAATNNFLAKRFSSSACWRCTLRGRDTIVFQRKFRRKIETPQLQQRLSVICRSHHGSIVKLLGASTSGEHIFLVYEFIKGANLADCLRNSRNPSFTVLSSWISRIQIATNLAHGLDYIHNNTGLNISLVHNRIKSSGIIVTDPSLDAKICHFGTAQLCGETEEQEISAQSESKTENEIVEDSDSREKLTRSGSKPMQFEGVRGYMSPEYQSTGVVTQKSDVYAFGVLILELISGEEPLKYKFEKRSGDFVRTSVIETAMEAVAGGQDGVRWWADRRLKDSFPTDVVERMIRLALDCVHVEPDKRPDMGRVAGKISKLYLASKNWSETVKMPGAISVSLGPR